MTATTTAPSSATTALALDGVTKVYGRGEHAVLALDQLSLTVRPGEFVCLVGASGCGKSTLLNLIAGLDSPSAGRITVAAAADAGRAATPGLMFQESALFPWLTVAANVDLPSTSASSPGAARTSCPAGCASGWRWPAPWPWTPRCC